MKATPLTQQKHDQEHISMHAFAFTLCARKNFREQEKQVYVKWMDAGVYGDWTFHTANVYVDRFDDPVAKKAQSTTRLTGLRYLSRWNYGLTVRIGTNYANAFATWRLSQLVHDPSTAELHSDLPRLAVGAEISFGE